MALPINPRYKTYISDLTSTDGDIAFNSKFVEKFNQYIDHAMEKEGIFKENLNDIKNKVQIPVNVHIDCNILYNIKFTLVGKIFIISKSIIF